MNDDDSLIEENGRLLAAWTVACCIFGAVAVVLAAMFAKGCA